MSLNVVVAFCLLLSVCRAAHLHFAGQGTPLEPPAVTPQPCCTLPVYEGNLSTIAVLGGGRGAAFVSGSFHFDLNNKRTASLQMVYAGGKASRVNVVDTAQAMYAYMPDKKVCQKLPAIPITNCLTKDAKFVLAMRMGGIGSYLDLNIFQITNNGSFPMASVAVTKDKCVFVSSTTITTTEGIKEQNTLFNLNSGIKDPSVFNIPDYCHKNEGAPMTSLARDGLAWHMTRRQPFL